MMPQQYAMYKIKYLSWILKYLQFLLQHKGYQWLRFNKLITPSTFFFFCIFRKSDGQEYKCKNSKNSSPPFFIALYLEQYHSPFSLIPFYVFLNLCPSIPLQFVFSSHNQLSLFIYYSQVPSCFIFFWSVLLFCSFVVSNGTNHRTSFVRL